MVSLILLGMLLRIFAAPKNNARPSPGGACRPPPAALSSKILPAAGVRVGRMWA
jgi:hypothetical protein